MSLARDFLESSIGKSIGRFKQRQASSNRDIALYFRVLKKRLEDLKKDKYFNPNNLIDRKRIQELEKTILQLTAIAVEIEKTADVESAIRNQSKK